jgi:flagellar motor switch protein FliN
MTVSVGQPGAINAQALPEDLNGPGLALVISVGSAAAVVVLPESSGLLPPWCAVPDATGRSKLTTLAQELGTLLLPEALAATDFQAGHVSDLAAALKRGGVADGAAMLPLELSAAAKGTARLIWPAPDPAAVLEADAQLTAAPTPALPAPPAKANGSATAATRPARQLPDYARSLLRIRVPVVVTLAENRQPLHRVIELGPGSILQFDKSCEEMLELSVGGHPVAQGEAVKVGDKFGLRITSMILPEERFQPVKPGRK